MADDQGGDAVDWPDLLGAFAHEIRTPLTSASMALQLAAPAPGGGFSVDEELGALLRQSLADLQQLAEEVHDTARIARGRASIGVGPVQLAEAISMAAASDGTPRIGTVDIPSVALPWDAPSLAGALSRLAAAANRAGDNSGAVALTVIAADPVQVELCSGGPAGEAGTDAGGVSLAASLGFAFFQAQQLVRFKGGSVEIERHGSTCCIRVLLPLA